MSWQHICHDGASYQHIKCTAKKHILSARQFVVLSHEYQQICHIFKTKGSLIKTKGLLLNNQAGKWIVTALFFLSLALSAVFAMVRTRQVDQNMRNDLLAKTHLLAETIDARNILQADANEIDPTTPRYLRLQQQLTAAKSTIPQAVHIYIMGENADGNVHLLMSTKTKQPDRQVLPGQLYEPITDKHLQVFETRSANVISPIDKAVGHHISALIPIAHHMPQNDNFILGVDVQDEDWKRQIRMLAGVPALCLLLTLWAILIVSILLIRKRNTHGAKWQKYIESGIVCVLGLVITFLSAWLMHERSQRIQNNAFQNLATSETAAFAEFLDSLENIELAGLAKLYKTNDSITESQFKRFTEYLTRNPSVDVWAWLESVPRDERQIFEQTMRESGYPEFSLWAQDEQGNRLPAPLRDQHYVLQYLSPMRGEQTTLGFDLASEKTRKEAIQEAVRTSLPTATDPIQLILSSHDKNVTSMLLFRPVFSTDASRELIGLAVAALRLDDALTPLQSDDTIAIHLCLADHDGTIDPLYPASDSRHDTVHENRFSRPIFAFGRTFIASASPEEIFLKDYPAYGGLNTATIGTIITLLFTLFAIMIQQRSQTLKKLVKERTNELQHDIEKRKKLEIKLQAQNTILRTEQAVSPDAILVVNEKDIIISCNQQFCDLCNVPSSELLQHASKDALPRILNKLHDPDMFVKKIQQLNASRTIEEHEEIHRKDGMILERFSYPIITEDGNYHGRIWYYRDITDQKRQEQYSEMSRCILEILNSPMPFEEAIHLVLAEFNKQIEMDAIGIRLQQNGDFPFYAQIGFDVEYLQAENSLIERDKCNNVCRNPDGTHSLECTCGLVLSGKTDPKNPLFTERGSAWTNNAAEIENLPAVQDPRVNPRNTCIKWGYTSVALIPIKEANKIVGLLQLCDQEQNRFTPFIIETLENICIHIGAALMRKRVEQELASNEARLKVLFSESPVSIMVHDIETSDPIDANKTAWLSYGYESFEEMKEGKIWTDPPYSQKEAQQCMQQVLKNGEQKFEWMSVRKDGSIFWELVCLRVITINGVERILATSTDITAQKEAEADREKLQQQLSQAQKLESIGRLAGGVAHDFNNMLQAILGNTELLLEDTNPDQEIYAELQEIRQCAKRSSELTNQLLTFARKQTIAPKRMDINETLQNTLKMIQRLIGENISLSWIPGNHLPLVLFDSVQMNQILVNLCINARDAIDKDGKITIHTASVTLTESDIGDFEDTQPGKFVLLSVEDNGHGMDKDTLDQAFEPFFTTKPSGQGTGLGLPSVYGAVRQNKGIIKIDSEPNKGTRVHIFIPAIQSKDREADQQQASIRKGSGNVLLVEDDKTILTLATRLLNKLGYTVIPAHGPTEAVNLANAAQNHIDLLMTDIIMPDMNGRELANKLQNAFPYLKVLFMSGYTDEIISDQGILDAGTAFLQKPFSLQELSEALNAAMQQ